MIAKPPPGIAAAFHKSAMRRPCDPMFVDQRRVCWLFPFDPLKRHCKGRWEAFHFLGKQEVRNSPALYGLDDPEMMALIEYDDRNAGPGCVEHHRRLDSQADAGPDSALVVPRSALPWDVEEYIAEYGLESLAESRFPAT